MRIRKFVKTLPGLAVVAGLSAVACGNALAAESLAAQAPVAAETGPVTTADYVWNGRHYVYRFHGKYFNHRRWHNNVWVYY
jgi:hypothetical protein